MATAAKEKAGRKIQRKLTLRSFGTIKELRVLAESGGGKEVDFCTIIGAVHNAKVGNGDNGEFIKLEGVFQGRNDQTGELTDECGMAILPNYIANSIVAAMKQGGSNVQFNVKFTIKENPTSAVGYVFEAANMLPPVASAVLASLWDGVPTLEGNKHAQQLTDGTAQQKASIPADAVPVRKSAPAPAPVAKKRSR